MFTKNSKISLLLINKIRFDFSWSENHDIDIVVFSLDKKGKIKETNCSQNLSNDYITFNKSNDFLEKIEHQESISFNFKNIKDINKLYICAISNTLINKIENFKLTIINEITNEVIKEDYIEDIEDSSSLHICTLNKDGFDWEINMELNSVNGKIEDLRDILSD